MVHLNTRPQLLLVLCAVIRSVMCGIDYTSSQGSAPSARSYASLPSLAYLYDYISVGQYESVHTVIDYVQQNTERVNLGKTHISRVHNHTCDYVLVSDNPKNCLVKPGCHHISAKKLETNILSSNLYLCVGTPHDYSEEHQLTVVKVKSNRRTMFEHTTSYKGTSEVMSFFLENRFDWYEIANIYGNIVVPRVCLSDVDTASVMRGRIVAGKYLYESRTALAYNCTSEYIGALNEFLSYGKEMSVLDRYYIVSPTLETNVNTPLTKLGLKITMHKTVNNMVSRTGAVRPCEDVAFDLHTTFVNLLYINAAMIFDKEYALVRRGVRDGFPLIDLCLTNFVVESTAKLPLLYHEDAWYERITHYILNSVELILPSVLNTALTAVGTIIITSFGFLLTLVLGFVLENAWLTLLALFIAIYVLARIIASLKTTIEKLTSPGINISVDRELLSILTKASRKTLRQE